MEESEAKRKHFPVWLRTLLFILVPVGIFAILIGMPANIRVHFSNCRWGLKGAKVLRLGDRRVLLFHIRSHGKWKQRSFEKFLTVDLAQGKQLAEYVTYNWNKPFGLTKEYLWVRQGGVGSKRFVAFSLPGLDESMNLEKLLDKQPKVKKPLIDVRMDPDGTDGLVLKGADGKWFSFKSQSGQLKDRAAPTWNPWWEGALKLKYCENPPRPPRSVDQELLLEGKFVCDNATGNLIELNDGDRFVAYQDIKTERGKLIFGRLSNDKRWIWKFSENERFGKRPRDQHGYRISFATLLPKVLVLLLEQEDAFGDMRLVALDVEDGRQVWALRYK